MVDDGLGSASIVGLAELEDCFIDSAPECVVSSLMVPGKIKHSLERCRGRAWNGKAAETKKKIK